MDEKGLLIALINVQIASLSARYDEARNYTMNTSMKIETQLCRAQINALEEERSRVIQGR